MLDFTTGKSQIEVKSFVQIHSHHGTGMHTVQRPYINRLVQNYGTNQAI